MKTKIKVNKDELLKAILEVEATNKFSTRQSLADAVAQTAWATGYKPKPITSSVILLRIAEFKLDNLISTAKGKRGRQAGLSLSSSHKQAMLDGRKKTVSKEFITSLKKMAPLVFHKMIDKFAENPTSKSGIRLKCLECCGFDRKEVKNCTVISCPLHSLRK